MPVEIAQTWFVVVVMYQSIRPSSSYRILVLILQTKVSSFENTLIELGCAVNGEVEGKQFRVVEISTPVAQSIAAIRDNPSVKTVLTDTQTCPSCATLTDQPVDEIGHLPYSFLTRRWEVHSRQESCHTDQKSSNFLRQFQVPSPCQQERLAFE